MFNKSQLKMKTTLLTVFALVIGITLSAQKTAKISPEKANLKAKAISLPCISEQTIPNAMFRQNDGPRTPGVNETVIGSTVYDLQSNSNVQNRIYAYPDGTIGATWTMGFANDAFADRGTGYNYFDGTSWGAEPTERIEGAVRTGWPSYAPLGDGEMVIAHGGGLQFSKRDTKGTGDWTTTLIPNTAGYTWSRSITSNGKIHVISNTNAIYQGLNFAIVYLSSSDNGATWTTPVILPGMDAGSMLTGFIGFDGFGGDAYSWAAPKGDTIAFVFGDPFGGIWVMKSLDNGTTWTKTTIYEFPDLSGMVETPDAASFDETYDIALDNEGKVHFVGCRYKFGSFDASVAPIASWSYYPYTDGVVYWNEDMPQIDTSYLNNPDTLFNHGMWIGSMIDLDGSGEIEFPDAGSDAYPWGDYRYSGLSSMPQIEIDNSNNMFVSYSCLREDLVNSGANPTVQLYRHLYLTSKLTYEPEWCEPRDLTGDIEHSYDECVWGAMALAGDKIHIIVQVDPEPGVGLAGDLDAWGDNYMYHITFPTFVSVKPIDIAKDVNVSPNPATEFANVEVNLNSASKVEVNVYDVMGKLVLANNYGQQASGSHIYKINTSSLPAGVYVFNIQASGSQTTKKVIVK